MPEEEVTTWFLVKVGLGTAVASALLALLSFGIVVAMSTSQNSLAKFFSRLFRG